MGLTRFKKSKVVGGEGLAIFNEIGAVVDIAIPGGVFDAIDDVDGETSATAADNAAAINAILKVLRDAHIIKSSTS